MIRGLGTPEPPKPQYYNVTCPEGHVLRGLRTEGYQALRCPTCGEGIFVLPRSPLPEPPRPNPAHGKRKARDSAASVDEGPIELTEAPTQVPEETDHEIESVDADQPRAEIVDDSQIPEEYLKAHGAEPRSAPREHIADPNRDHSVTSKRQPRSQQTRSRQRSPRASSGERGHAPGPGQIFVEERSSFLERVRRRRHLLLFVGVVLLVSLTVGYRFWRNWRQNLPQVAEANWTQGVEALESGEFDAAKLKLARAAAAFKALGGTDERVSKSRQLADEAAILADLVSIPLDEMIVEAARSAEADWASRFRNLYQGQAVLIDAHIAEPLPDVSKRNGYELDYRILAGRGPVPARSGRFDLTGFRLFEGRDLKVGDHVLFGARLEAVSLDGKDWRVKLAADSGVTMTNFKALKYALLDSLGEEGP